MIPPEPRWSELDAIEHYMRSPEFLVDAIGLLARTGPNRLPAYLTSYLSRWFQMTPEFATNCHAVWTGDRKVTS